MYSYYLQEAAKSGTRLARATLSAQYTHKRDLKKERKRSQQTHTEEASKRDLAYEKRPIPEIYVL